MEDSAREAASVSLSSTQLVDVANEIYHLSKGWRGGDCFPYQPYMLSQILHIHMQRTCIHTHACGINAHICTHAQIVYAHTCTTHLYTRAHT